MGQGASVTTLPERWASLPAEATGAAPVSLPMSVLARGERRLEAEAYLTGGHDLRGEIEASGAFTPLGEMADAWQPSRLKGILVGPEDGEPFLAATQVFDIRPTPRKWVAPSKTPDFAGRFVEAGWILVTCSGSVGDPMVTFAPHLGTVISHDLLRMRPRDPRDRGHLYTFLRSATGRLILRSSKYGSIVKHLEPEHVATVPVPTVPETLRDQLEARISEVFTLREKAFLLTQEAERLYGEQFAAVDTTIDRQTYEVRAAQMFGARRRLDADYYNRDAAAIDDILGSHPLETLGALVEDIVLPNRFKRVFVTGGGTPYISSEQIYKVNPEITKRVVHGDKKPLDDYLVREGSLLVARSGQTYGLFGSVILANKRHEGSVISEDIVRVVPKTGPGSARPGYLALALSHPTLGRPLVIRLAFGASIPHLAPKDLATVAVPRLGAVEDAISDRMEEASLLRMRADEEEDTAVAMLDAATDDLSPARQLHDVSQTALDVVRGTTARFEDDV